MVTITQIQRPIADELKEFDKFITEQITTDNDVMGVMLREALSSRGKGVRPMLVMLCAAMVSHSGYISKRTYIAAMMVEMIHLASLIHDDVIDEAPTRRSKPTLNAIWQSKRAVLVGDYILARNLSIATKSGQFDLLSHVIDAISILCEGEVIQDHCARRHRITREEYLAVIAKKTASLISISASVGAKSASANAGDVELLREFGRALGMAFQIQDDILDYAPSERNGKESYQDLREGKITLPLLILIEREADEARREALFALVERAGDDDEACREVVKFVEDGGGVELASQVVQGYIERAVSVLGNFKESPYRAALVDLCAFVGERDH
ncbi:MAG: polyprenyl synthetase family protein [Rikenellaceae bacterium]